MELIQFFWKILASVVVVALIGIVFRLYNAVVAHPRRLRSALHNQGLSGPPPAFLLGNIMEMKRSRAEAAKAATVYGGPPSSHNCGAALLPFFDVWRKQYGN